MIQDNTSLFSRHVDGQRNLSIFSAACQSSKKDLNSMYYINCVCVCVYNIIVACLNLTHSNTSIYLHNETMKRNVFKNKQP